MNGVDAANKTLEDMHVELRKYESDVLDESMEKKLEKAGKEHDMWTNRSTSRLQEDKRQKSQACAVALPVCFAAHVCW